MNLSRSIFDEVNKTTQEDKINEVRNNDILTGLPTLVNFKKEAKRIVKIDNTKKYAISNIDFTKLYGYLYQRPIAEVRFEGYIYQNLTLTENGVAYVKLTDKLMKEYGVDSAAAGNMINDLKFVNEITVWVFLSEDIKSNLIRANIRSRGPYINEIATIYGGGGHKYASGARLVSWQQVDNLISDLDKILEKYNEDENK